MHLDSFMTKVAIIQKPVHRPVSANDYNGFYMIGTFVMKELRNILENEDVDILSKTM